MHETVYLLFADTNGSLETVRCIFRNVPAPDTRLSCFHHQLWFTIT